jgi:hypothetical protein
MKDEIQINQFRKGQKNKSKIMLTFETDESGNEPKTNLIKGKLQKIIKQISKKEVKKILAFKKKKNQANFGKPTKPDLIFKTHNP